MASHVEDDSETATEAWKRVPPLDSDDYTRDDKSSPCSSPPPANKNVSFKPFTLSRAQKRANAEKTSREKEIAGRRNASASEDRKTENVDHVEKRAAEEAPSNKVHGSTDLKSLIDAAKQKALASNKPKKAERVAELYQRSLNDGRLTVLLETALRTNATLEQQHELQRYIDSTKTTKSISRIITPRDGTNTQPITIMSDSEAQSETGPIAAATKTTTTTQPTERDTTDHLATFCATQLWPRYCRLTPGPNTSIEFKNITATTINDRGQSVPVQSVPEVWLEEVVTELSHLLHVARVDKGAWIQKLMAKPGHKGQDVHALLAEEVLWATYQGPFRQKEARGGIGVLLECVGIERKGNFWFG
jgi:hypothetical protein